VCAEDQLGVVSGVHGGSAGEVPSRPAVSVTVPRVSSVVLGSGWGRVPQVAGTHTLSATAIKRWQHEPPPRRLRFGCTASQRLHLLGQKGGTTALGEWGHYSPATAHAWNCIVERHSDWLRYRAAGHSPCRSAGQVSQH
jgi:hypothetical protein